MDSNIVTIIVTIILSAIGFFIGYQMLRLEKNVKDIIDQIIERHKGDRSFRDKEFLNYFHAGGNIWLSAMDEKFRKMLNMQKYTALGVIAVAVLLIATDIASGVFYMAILPVLLILFVGRNLMNFKSVAADDKTNSKKAIEYYKKDFPEDSMAKNSSDSKNADKMAGWFLTAKRTCIQTGKLAKGKMGQSSGSESQEDLPNRAARRAQKGHGSHAYPRGMRRR